MLTPGAAVEEIEEIKEDLMSECKNYGHVMKIKVRGACELMAQFVSSSGAKAASGALNGRMFDGRQLGVSLISEADFLSNDAP